MLDSITKGYMTLHPAAAARTLARLEIHETKAILEATPPQLTAKLLEHMPAQAAGRCLVQLPPKRGGEILGRMRVLAAVAALRLMERDQVRGLLSATARPAAAQLRLRLRYSERVIGAFVDSDIVTLTPEHRVGDALRLLRRTGQRAAHTIPVLDERRRLAGVVDLAELLGARDRSMIESVMRPAAVVLSGRSALQTVANHPAWLSDDSLPVVNREGGFLGVLQRSKVMEKERQLLSEVADHNELVTTRAALAEIFWMGVGAFFVDDTAPATQDKANDGHED